MLLNESAIHRGFPVGVLPTSWHGGIEKEAIRIQLSRILASAVFASAGRMQQFLSFVVDETLEGRDSQLGEYLIALAVFDRDESYYPGVDPIVRNGARRLRQKLLEYYQGLDPHAQDDVLIEIPKGGYVPVFSLLSSFRPVALRYRARVAVLPFEALPRSEEGKMYCQALSSSISTQLSGFDGVEVIAQGLPEERVLPLSEMISRLRIVYMIRGCVLKPDRECRITVNLIRAADSTQVWAREYDFEEANVFKIQSEVAGRVLREIGPRLGLHTQPAH